MLDVKFRDAERFSIYGHTREADVMSRVPINSNAAGNGSFNLYLNCGLPDTKALNSKLAYCRRMVMTSNRLVYSLLRA